MNYSDLEKALSVYLRVTAPEIRQIIHTAPYSYKHYQIEKRNGGKRDIFHPTPELKAIQRWLVAELFSSLEVSPAAMAYEAGCSIREHANAHRQSNYFTKLDFSDFFPSIQIDWILEFLHLNLANLDADAISAIARLTCRWIRKGTPLALTIGAPSSPSLSNRIIFDLDTSLLSMAGSNGVIYTRYADDIYFSCSQPNVLHDVERAARIIISQTAPALQINEAKTLRLSRKRNVAVSGVIITPDRKLSIGRDIKRRIRTRIHLWSLGQLGAKETQHLRGLITFATDVEPDFRKLIDEKFGEKLVSTLISGGSQPER